MPEVKSPGLILKLAQAMEQGGFIDMEISPEEFCNLINHHYAIIRKLNFTLLSPSPLKTWTKYSQKEKQKRFYDESLVRLIKQNPKTRYYSQLTWQGHTFIAEHWDKIVELESWIGYL